MKKWILEIFRAGKQTDSSGKSREWTEEDLDKIVSQYEASEHEAPIVIGHPKTDDPAFGWIDRVFREGKTLFAEVTEVAKEFREAVNQGFYKKRSISLYPDLTLKHVGFLGAVPPAVKGLADIKFNAAADSAICFEMSPEGSEFSDYETAFGFRSVGRLLRNLREFIIADKGQEVADRVVPNWEIQGLENFKDPEPEEKRVSPMFNENHSPEGEPMTEQEKKEFEALQAKVASFSETEKALADKTAEAESEKNRADAAEAKLAETEKAAAEATETKAAEEVKAFAEGLVKAGKIPAAELETEIETLNLLRKSGGVREFSEGGEKKSVSSFDARKAALEARKPSVDFSEVATRRTNSDGKSVSTMDFGDAELHAESAILYNEAKKIQAAEGISFAEAVAKARG